MKRSSYGLRMCTSVDAMKSVPGAVHRLTPMLHVADVEKSVAFYALLGFKPGEVMRDHGGRAFWARMGEGAATIMFAAASGPVNAEEQAVIVYLYSKDVGALRRHLLASGVHDGGAFCGAPGPNGGRSVAFAIARPHYMPAGEMRVADLDGYCLLVGQLE
jgi:catechol 2,3-dioxygenase-like lactoylglutathione lyase family enzyme